MLSISLRKKWRLQVTSWNPDGPAVECVSKLHSSVNSDAATSKQVAISNSFAATIYGSPGSYDLGGVFYDETRTAAALALASRWQSRDQVRLDQPRLFPADATAPSIHGSFLETISLLGAAFTAEMWPYSWFGDCHAQSVAIKKILPVRTEAAYCRIEFGAISLRFPQFTQSTINSHGFPHEALPRGAAHMDGCVQLCTRVTFSGRCWK